MACYICEICGNLKDDDWDPGEEYEDGLVCGYCFTEHVYQDEPETTNPSEDGSDAPDLGTGT